MEEFLFYQLPREAIFISCTAIFYRPKVREKLDSGISLIVDRYSYSGVAFSAAKEVIQHGNSNSFQCFNIVNASKFFVFVSGYGPKVVLECRGWIA